MSEEIVARPEHLHPLCHKGARTWFPAHGLSYPDFVRSGTPVEVLEATGDALALEVAARARKQHGEKQ